MSFGTSSGGMVPTVGFPFPAVASGSFTVVKTGVYEAHLQGGGSGGYFSTYPGSGGAMIMGSKLLLAGQVVNYLVGAAGLGNTLNPGGTTVFDQFAAAGGTNRDGGVPSDISGTVQASNIGYSGGSGRNSSTNPQTPRLAGEVIDPTKTIASPDGGSSVYGKPGNALGASATGYGAGGAIGDAVTPGGNGSQGCIYLFGPL